MAHLLKAGLAIAVFFAGLQLGKDIGLNVLARMQTSSAPKVA